MSLDYTRQAQEWYSGASSQRNGEDTLRRAILVAVSGLVFGGFGFLAGCGDQGSKAPGIPTAPKWKGAAYRIAFDAKPGKPSAAGVTIPAIQYTANPEALERRATLVVRFDSSGVKRDQPIMDQMVMGPVDISGTEGALSADYMDGANKGLAHLLGAYCVKGKVKITVALARSSLSPQAGDAEVNSKRLSDWLPLEVVFKNPHPTC